MLTAEHVASLEGVGLRVLRARRELVELRAHEDPERPLEPRPLVNEDLRKCGEELGRLHARQVRGEELIGVEERRRDLAPDPVRRSSLEGLAPREELAEGGAAHVDRVGEGRQARRSVRVAVDHEARLDGVAERDARLVDLGRYVGRRGNERVEPVEVVLDPPRVVLRARERVVVASRALRGHAREGEDEVVDRRRVRVDDREVLVEGGSRGTVRRGEVLDELRDRRVLLEVGEEVGVEREVLARLVVYEIGRHGEPDADHVGGPVVREVVRREELVDHRGALVGRGARDERGALGVRREPAYEVRRHAAKELVVAREADGLDVVRLERREGRHVERVVRAGEGRSVVKGVRVEARGGGSVRDRRHDRVEPHSSEHEAHLSATRGIRHGRGRRERTAAADHREGDGDPGHWSRLGVRDHEDERGGESGPAEGRLAAAGDGNEVQPSGRDRRGRGSAGGRALVEPTARDKRHERDENEPADARSTSRTPQGWSRFPQGPLVFEVHVRVRTSLVLMGEGITHARATEVSPRGAAP